ncbi:TniB family NTP-binding protein [Ruegeria sp. HKCCA6837]|uniref:TniB family NTP-binding protein n=1 Tax=Ruegeria sp. HKCCA6837 TaxID=2682989 RepID=UPI001487BECA|nr:TniB family NTP-binding protein [Ruegeria sp. HKCCA6837]
MLDQTTSRALQGAFIRHSRHEWAVSEIKRLLNIAATEGGRIIPILGPTRCGKTELTKDLKAQVENDRHGPSAILVSSDVILGRLAPRPSERDYYGSCLRSMGFDFVERERPAQIRERLFRLVAEHGIQTIIIDEVNHCAETLTRHSRRQAADHFKTIVDETSVTLILAGLPMFEAVMDSNEQFAGRCLNTIRMNPYWWSVEADRIAFCDAIFAAFYCLEESGILLEFDQDDMVRRLYGVSGGRVPVALEVLRAPLALGAQNSQYSTKTIARAATDSGLERDPYQSFFQEEPPSDTELIRSYIRVMADAGLEVEPTTSHELAIMRGV